MTLRRGARRVAAAAAALIGLVALASLSGIGFDGVGDVRWAVAAAMGLLAVAWFDDPKLVAVANDRESGFDSGLTNCVVLGVALAIAWLTPRAIAPQDDSAPSDSETWMRRDELGPDWPTLVAQGRDLHRRPNELGASANLAEGLLQWTLDTTEPRVLRLDADPPSDEPPIVLSMPPGQVHLAGVPSIRRGNEWEERLRAVHGAARLAYTDEGPSIAGALTPQPLRDPFDDTDDTVRCRIGKATREELSWATNGRPLVGALAYTLPSEESSEWAATLPRGATPRMTLNVDDGIGLLRSAPVLYDDGRDLAALRLPNLAAAPSAVDLLGDAGTETGPAFLTGWLRETRSRTAASPALVVLPSELPWRDPFVGFETATARGLPRPTPRSGESTHWGETLAAFAALLLLGRAAWKEV